MELYVVLAFFALLGAFGSIYTGVLITKDLQERRVDAKPNLVRWMIFKYMAQYRRITLEETGKVGRLYNQRVTISTITAVLALGAIMSKALG